jgi:hypothetical protein
MNFNERWKHLSRDEYGHFERIYHPKSQRRDMHAMVLLDELFPGAEPLLTDSFYCLEDEVYLSIKQDSLSTLTDEQIIELARCGVQYDHLSQRLWIQV